MKSTTLKRANITKEKVAMMEALSRYNKEHAGEDYYRSQQAKNKELDVLWQSFGIKPNKNEKDLIIMALVLHDGYKSGCPKEKYTRFDHPLLVSKFIILFILLGSREM